MLDMPIPSVPAHEMALEMIDVPFRPGRIRAPSAKLSRSPESVSVSPTSGFMRNAVMVPPASYSNAIFPLSSESMRGLASASYSAPLQIAPAAASAMLSICLTFIFDLLLV